MNAKKVLWALLAISFLFFTARGLEYWSLGSQWPLMIPLGMLFIAGISYLISSRLFRFTIRIWAGYLILWALARISIDLIFLFSDPLEVSEAHIRSQFSFFNRLLSVFWGGAGVYLFKKAFILRGRNAGGMIRD